MEKVRNYLNLVVENEPVCNCRLNYNILPIDHYYEYTTNWYTTNNNKLAI